MRKLYNEELNEPYSPDNIRAIKSRRMRRTGRVGLVGERRGAYRVLVGKPEAKGVLGRRKRKWEDNIKKDLQEVGLGHELD